MTASGGRRGTGLGDREIRPGHRAGVIDVQVADDGCGRSVRKRRPHRMDIREYYFMLDKICSIGYHQTETMVSHVLR